MAFDQLKAESLICPTFSDLGDPEAWVEITGSGRDALARGDLDDLDSALKEISPSLVEMRAGAWSAVGSSSPSKDDAGGMEPQLQLSRTVRLLVPPDRLKDARRALKVGKR